MGRGHIQIYIYIYIHGHRNYQTESAQWADSVKIIIEVIFMATGMEKGRCFFSVLLNTDELVHIILYHFNAVINCILDVFKCINFISQSCIPSFCIK